MNWTQCRRSLVVILSAPSLHRYRTLQSYQTSHRYHRRYRVRLLPLHQSRLRAHQTKNDQSTSNPPLIKILRPKRLSATTLISDQRPQYRSISRPTGMHQNVSRPPSQVDLTLTPCIPRNTTSSVIIYLTHRSRHTSISEMVSCDCGLSALGSA
jgi:hypothetical protein